MKAINIIAILVVLLLIVGCKPAEKQEIVKPVVKQPIAEPVQTIEEPQTAVVQAKENLSFEDADATIQRLTAACKAGAKSLCITLKTKYNIDVSAETPTTE